MLTSCCLILLLGWEESKEDHFTSRGLSSREAKQLTQAVRGPCRLSFQGTLLHPLPKLPPGAEGMFFRMVSRGDFICFRQSAVLIWHLLYCYWEVCSKAFLVHWNCAGHKANKIEVCFPGPGQTDACLNCFKADNQEWSLCWPSRIPCWRKMKELLTQAMEGTRCAREVRNWVSEMLRSPRAALCKTAPIVVFQDNLEESHVFKS